MKPWRDIRIDTTSQLALQEAVVAHMGDNLACKLSYYWRSRRSPSMLARLDTSPSLPMGFVGNGWPEFWDQSWAIKNDRHDVAALYHSSDLHTRDVGDTIYQVGQLINIMGCTVVDIGSGYGRLGYALLKKSGARYIGVDYSPIGLLVAPQFLRQTTGLPVVDWTAETVGFDRAVSLPAWLLESIPERSVDTFVSIHSFQEMEWGTIGYYIEWMSSRASEKAIFYSINMGDAYYIPNSWELMIDQPYPINKDGGWQERLWKMT